MKYVLRGKEVVPEPDVLKWAMWFEGADKERQVKLDYVDGVMVSTVFVGLDHSFGNGPPLLFETLIRGGDRDGEIERYSTWAEAEEGHGAIVRSLRKEEALP